jgi:uncharacterized protein with PIN domain
MRAAVRFYGALNDFLPAHRRQQTLVCTLGGRVSIKDMIESLGVPHPEVDRLLVNGDFVDFRYVVRDGDRITAYPSFHALDLGTTGRLSPAVSADIRFVADVHLGRLAGYLRLAGFDTLYRNDWTDAELADLSAADGRILLTRDVALLKRSTVTRGCYVRNTQPARQLVEVLRRFDCAGSAQPFTRCARCNGVLQPADKAHVARLLPPRTRECQDTFVRCTGCGSVYWPGSHYERIRGFLTLALTAAAH